MTKTIPLLQWTLVVGLALGTGACQTMSDAASGVGHAASSVGNAVASLDPTGLLGGDSDAPTTVASGDAAAPTASDAQIGTTPDLASLPDRPPTASADQHQAATQSLAADGAQARYSADALRAGTEAAAPPPGAPDAAAARLATAQSDAPSAYDAAPSAQPPAAPSAGQTAAVAPMSASMPSPVSAPPPGAQPAVPANTPFRGATGSGAVMSDAALGFRPSSAPPLNSSITQWVSAPVVANYRRTASLAGVTAMATPAVPAVAGRGAVGSDASGPVTANLDAISTGPAGSIAAMNGGVPPTAVIYFPGDGTTISAAARARIREAVNQFRAGGGVSSIRVVGHASSRTSNMPVERHLEVIFDKSQKRANAVAQELIRQGVPADRVLVEAVGDSQPVYYESMPQGEDGNRRAEIFVQG